jgi:hypothetical protein
MTKSFPDIIQELYADIPARYTRSLWETLVQGITDHPKFDLANWRVDVRAGAHQGSADVHQPAREGKRHVQRPRRATPRLRGE